jgi:L-fuculose-phosphate aldolase
VNYVGGDVRDQLAHVGRMAVAAGLVVGSGGNLSARVPGRDEIWVTAAGTWLDRLDQRSFVKVSLAGRGGPSALPRRGSAALLHWRLAILPSRRSAGRPDRRMVAPTSELPLHLAMYRARPDVTAVVHLHPQSVLLLDALDLPIELATTDHVGYLRRIVTAPFRPPGSQLLADEAAALVADGTDCVVLARHGCSLLADSVELAHKRALYLEEAARLSYRAALLGGARALARPDDEFAEWSEAAPSGPI